MNRNSIFLPRVYDSYGREVPTSQQHVLYVSTPTQIPPDVLVYKPTGQKPNGQNTVILTGWELIPSTDSPNKNLNESMGTYTVPSEEQLTVWSRVKIAHNVPLSGSGAMSKLQIIRNGTVLTSTNLPTAVSSNGYYLPIATYDVEYNGSLQNGDQLAVQITSLAAADLTNIVKAALGSQDTVFGVKH